MIHARRRYVDVLHYFPKQVHYILTKLSKVYKNEATTKKRAMSSTERLEFHQKHSKPLMDDLKEWLEEKKKQRIVEPNSAPGDAIQYMDTHWKKLTLFLRVPAAPIDNSICERILKKAILHRKNSLFFKTMNGAPVGDTFMSLIHTCELNGGAQYRRGEIG